MVRTFVTSVWDCADWSVGSCACVCFLQSYPLDNKTLLAIEIPVMALLEAKRYEGYKKTGEVRSNERKKKQGFLE